MDNLKVEASPHALITELDDGAVLLNLETESYFSLNGVGTDMWHQLTTQATVQAAFEALLAQYEVDPTRLESDLHAFINDLKAAELVVVSEG